MLPTFEDTYRIIGAALEVSRTLGCGFTEYVYQDALEYEFMNSGIDYQREVSLPVLYKGVQLRHTYAADFICFKKVIIEVKAVKQLLPEHEAQLLNYLNATKLQLGYLINFGSPRVEYKRLIISKNRN